MAAVKPAFKSGLTDAKLQDQFLDLDSNLEVAEDASSTASTASCELQDASPSNTSLASAELEARVVAMFSVQGDTDMEAGLKRTEESFLAATYVNTPDVSEAAIAARFSKTTMPQEPSSVSSYMQGMVSSVVVDSMHCASPNMIGHMTMALPNFSRPLARLNVAMHQNNVKVETAKTTTFQEREALAMLHRVLYQKPDEFYQAEAQNPSQALGLFTSGGTLANASALWIARNRALAPREGFPGVSKSGVFKALQFYGYSDAVVMGSTFMHYSMNKCLDVLGLGEQSLCKIPVDEASRVDLRAMEEAILRYQAENVLVFAIVGIAGTTESGSIDPLEDMAVLASKYGIHFHVDAAWGGPLIFSETHAAKLRGIELADTITLDGHKQLYLPMGCGICFLKEPELCTYVKKTANYIIREESFDLGKFTLEGSRGSNAMYLHANLNIIGTKGYGALIDRSVRLVRYMADTVMAHPLFEVVVQPMSNILLYRHVPSQYAGKDLAALPDADCDHVDGMNRALQNVQKNIGNTFVSRTTIFSPRYRRTVVALRVVIANPLTGEGNIDQVLADQVALIQKGFAPVEH